MVEFKKLRWKNSFRIMECVVKNTRVLTFKITIQNSISDKTLTKKVTSIETCISWLTVFCETKRNETERNETKQILKVSPTQFMIFIIVIIHVCQ